MEKTKICMLGCLRAYFNKTQYNLGEDDDIKALYNMSRSHNLAPIVFSVIKNDSVLRNNNAVYQAFENDFYDAVVRYDLQKSVIDNITDILTKNGINHIYFKGSEIKEYYPVPELRSMGDVDLLIKTDDRSEVKKLLTQNGYELLEDNGPVYSYGKDGVLIEVHTSIVNGKVGSKDAQQYYKNAYDFAVFDGCVGRFEPTYHLAYLIVHIAHHFWFYGAGAKMILDLAVMIRHFGVDPDGVLGILEQIGLDDFAKVILSVCYKWFGVGKCYVDDTQDTEDFLMNFGAFGNVNRNVGVIVRRKALEEGKKSTFSAKLAFAFPSYEKMKNIPYMKFMEGRPYLLLWGWIYRFYYNIKNRRKFLFTATSDMAGDDAKQEAQKEIKYFEEIGLI